VVFLEQQVSVQWEKALLEATTCPICKDPGLSVGWRS
jgi:hypothetical protein